MTAFLHRIRNRFSLLIVALLSSAVLTTGNAQADVVLTSTYDVERVNRTNSNGPHVSDRDVLTVVNFAWKGWVYLQFDLSQVQGLENATGMTLRLFEIDSGYSADLKNDVIDLYATTDSWTNQSAYSAMPGTLELLDRLVQGNNVVGWAEWSIDAGEIADDASDGTLSLVLENTQQTGSWNMTMYRSANYDLGQYAPQLVIQGDVSLVPEPSTAVLLAGLALVGLARRNRRVGL